MRARPPPRSTSDTSPRTCFRSSTVSVAVPAEYTDSTSFDAAVFLALADRVVDEYDAAVTDEEAIELYGEYWDARGFLARMEARFEAMASDLDGETRSAVDGELGILRKELETARPPWDVENSVAALHRLRRREVVK